MVEYTRLWENLKFVERWNPNGVYRNRGQQNKGTLILKWGLRHLLHSSTQGSGKFQAESVSFYFVTKKLLNVLLTCTFIPWLWDSLDLPRYGSKWWHPGWCLWLTMVWPMSSCKFCYQETFFVLICGETVYI